MLRREEGSTGDISANEAKNTDSLLSGKGTFLVHVQIHVHQDTQVLFCRTAFHFGGLELFLPECMTYVSLCCTFNPHPQVTSLPRVFRKFEPIMQICRALRLDSDYLKIFQYVSTTLSVLLSLIILEDQSTFWPLELYLFKAYISSQRTSFSN